MEQWAGHTWYVVLVLGLACPGLGHARIGRTRRGLLFLAGVWAVFALARPLGWADTFPGMAAAVGLAAVLWLWSAADAAVAAKRLADRDAPAGARLSTCFLAGVLIWTGARLLLPNLVPVTPLQVPSVSMRETLRPGDVIMAKLDGYARREPARGDLAVFTLPMAPDTLQLKRVAAVAGDTVELRAGRLAVNGRDVEEPYARLDTRGRARLTVPAGQIFVLGDNRAESYDSRMYGPIPMSALAGRALYICWSDDPARIGTPLD